jgi:hypothetical protein
MGPCLVRPRDAILVGRGVRTRNTHGEVALRAEERRIERGLDAFGEPLVTPALDAPGRDMLELDEELGPNEEWVYETIEVDDPGQLPPGVYLDEAGEILPIKGPHPDDEGEWDSGGD